jgi:hypothetical protein
VSGDEADRQRPAGQLGAHRSPFGVAGLRRGEQGNPQSAIDRFTGEIHRRRQIVERDRFVEHRLDRRAVDGGFVCAQGGEVAPGRFVQLPVVVDHRLIGVDE